MQIGITGGTGFIGSHLTARLTNDGHEVVLVARGVDRGNTERWRCDAVRLVEASVTDGTAVQEAFAGCEAVVHLAGINFERGTQTYESVHVHGTQTVVDAAAEVGAEKMVLSSFLRARPSCGSVYHESKWAAEEIVRGSDLAATIVKPGVTYGRGDHLVTHLARWLATIPVFARVGFRPRRLRPLAVDDLVDILAAAVLDHRLTDATVPVTGPEQITLEAAVRRIGRVIGVEPRILPLPVWVHVVNAWLQEQVLDVPLVSRAQVRMLAEELIEPAPKTWSQPLPPDLTPSSRFEPALIAASLPDRRRFGRTDLRL